MLNRRIIPALLIRDTSLVKGRRFRHHKYVGDPINAVKIFNDMEVDELLVFDISSSAKTNGPDFDFINRFASEAFMPVSYGGGVTDVEQAAQLFRLGIEKIVVNTAAHTNPSLITDLAREFGSQSIVVCVDYRRRFLRHPTVWVENGRRELNITPLQAAKVAEAAGAGEIIISSIEKEGARTGYDLDMIKVVAEDLLVPLVAIGGAGTLADMAKVFSYGKVTGLAAGEMFTHFGKHRAVLISYPSRKEIEEHMGESFGNESNL